MAKIKWYLIGAIVTTLPIPFVLSSYLPFSHLNYKNHNILRQKYQEFLTNKNFVDKVKGSTLDDPFGIGVYVKQLKTLLDHKDRTYNDYYFNKAQELTTSLENAQYLINLEQNSKDNKFISDVSGNDVLRFDRVTRKVLSNFLDPQFYDRLYKFRTDYTFVATDEEKNQVEVMYLNYKNSSGWKKLKYRQAILNYFDTDIRQDIKDSLSFWPQDVAKAFNDFPKGQKLTRWEKWNIQFKINGTKLISIKEIKDELLPQLSKLVSKDEDKVPYIVKTKKELQDSKFLDQDRVLELKSDVEAKISRAMLIQDLIKNHTIHLDPWLYSPSVDDNLSKLVKVIKDGDVLQYNLYTWKILATENKVYNDKNFEASNNRFLDTLTSDEKNRWRNDLEKYFPIFTWQLTNFKKVKKDSAWEKNYVIDSKYTNKEDVSHYVDISQDDNQLFLQINIVLKDSDLNISVGSKEKPFKLLIPIKYDWKANVEFWKKHNKYDPELQNKQWTIDGIVYHID